MTSDDSDPTQTSLLDSKFEEARRSRSPGQSEHGQINQTGLRRAEFNFVQEQTSVANSTGPRSLTL